MPRKKVHRAGVSLIPFVNTNILRKGRNMLFKSVLAPFQKNEPFHVINEYQYRDFHRNKYIRNRMLFPINIPTYFKVSFNYKAYKRDVRKRRPLIDLSGRPNWAVASGNQFLLSLNQIEKYSVPEIIEILYRLSIHPEIKNVDLPNNDLMKKVPGHIQKIYSGLKFKPLLQIFIYMHGIGYRNEIVMAKLAKNLLSKLVNFNDDEKLYPAMYGKFFFICMEAEWPERLGQPEMHDKLIEQIPKYLDKMPEDLISDLFEYCIDKEIITTNRDHLFDMHFLQHVWKRPFFFKPKSFLKNIECLIKMDYIEEDPELLEEELLPHVGKIIHNCEDVELMHKMIKTVDNLIDHGVSITSITETKDVIFRRILFVETKLKTIKNSDFGQIVSNDLKYYKMLQMEKKEKEKREMMERMNNGAHQI